METNCQYTVCKRLTLHSRIYKINNTRNDDQGEHMEGPLAYNRSIMGQRLCCLITVTPLRWERPSGCAASLGVSVGLAERGGRDTVVWRAQRSAAGGTHGRISRPHRGSGQLQHATH